MNKKEEEILRQIMDINLQQNRLQESIHRQDEMLDILEAEKNNLYELFLGAGNVKEKKTNDRGQYR